MIKPSNVKAIDFSVKQKEKINVINALVIFKKEKNRTEDKYRFYSILFSAPNFFKWNDFQPIDSLGTWNLKLNCSVNYIETIAKMHTKSPLQHVISAKNYHVIESEKFKRWIEEKTNERTNWRKDMRVLFTVVFFFATVGRESERGREIQKSVAQQNQHTN